MIELIEKRTLTSKHFEDNGENKLHAHIGHIHYFDKLDSKRLRGIDHNLIWDDEKKGWTFKYHSFRPLFPEYSDGWAEFRDLFEGKDQTMKYKAIGNKVAGVLIDKDDTNPLFDDNIDNKGVLYKGVFGENRDYILYNTRSKMVKVATVNNPNEQTEDAVFEWEVELPSKEVFRVDKPIDAEEMTAKGTQTNTEDGELVGYRLDVLRSKNFNTSKLTLIGDSELDGKEWFTYLEGYKAWDSEGNEIIIEARLSIVDGKHLLRKTIPVEFLQKAVGRVFTDTTTSYYAGSDDGRVRNNGSVYATVNSASTGVNVQSTGTSAECMNSLFSTTYYIDKTYFPIDTSGIPGTAIITAATFSHVLAAITDTNSDSLVVVSCSQTGALQTSDFDQFGSTYFSTAQAASSYTVDVRKNITLNSSGLAGISKTGVSGFGVRMEGDINVTTPTGGNTLQSYMSEETGTTKDPYLEVTYSEGTLYTKELDESITLVESQATQITAKIISETINLVEGFTKSFTTSRLFTETLALVDSIAIISVMEKSLSETLSIEDSQEIKQTGKGVVESLVVTDTINNLFIVNKSLLETITLVDTLTTVKQFFKTVSESLSLVDSLSRDLTAGILLQENISVVDRLFGLLNGINMKYNRKYSENSDLYVDKYNDV